MPQSRNLGENLSQQQQIRQAHLVGKENVEAAQHKLAEQQHAELLASLAVQALTQQHDKQLEQLRLAHAAQTEQLHHLHGAELDRLRAQRLQAEREQLTQHQAELAAQAKTASQVGLTPPSCFRTSSKLLLSAWHSWTAS